jgi:MOSC domain-containing protein YiiM
VLETTQALVAQGLEGDHFEGLPGGAGKRQVTLVREEDLLTAAQRLGRDDPLEPAQLRRNLVVAGLPMDDLRACRLRIGDAVVLEVTGGCPPCDRMDETVGPGGREALDGLGGLTARVVQAGTLRRGDPVEILPGA